MITETDVTEYAKYYYAVRTQLNITPLSFKEWKRIR